MPRWINEDKWAAEINAAAERFGVPAALVFATIGAESGFNPSAFRGEAAIQDGSAGLMQILQATARGEGYSGTLGQASALTGLFNPATNITYGTSFLARQYKRAGGDPAAAASAYNGGWRPELGFGVRATKPVRLCLARDASGKCIQYRDVKVGEYGNQPYVDKILGYYEYFRNKQAGQSAFVTSQPAPRYSPPLDAAHRTFLDEPESENGGRVGGSDNRTLWTQVRETVTALWARIWGA